MSCLPAGRAGTTTRRLLAVIGTVALLLGAAAGPGRRWAERTIAASEARSREFERRVEARRRGEAVPAGPAAPTAAAAAPVGQGTIIDPATARFDTSRVRFTGPSRRR